MSESNRPTQLSEVGGREPQHGFLRRAWLVFQVVQARLRFVLLLVVLGVVLANWDTLTGYYDKWTRPLRGGDEAAASDVEYFCPMHPFIVRDNRKEKCPVCHMDLARRKQGTGQAEPLPAGTVARVQLSPYRIVLAGVQTAEVQYLRPTRELTAFGTVEFNETLEARITARQKARIVRLHVNYTGQAVKEKQPLAVLDVRYSPDLTVTLEDLRRAQNNGNREAERLARQRLQLWDIDDKQIQEFLRTGKVGTEVTVVSPIEGHVIKKYQREGDFVDEGTPLYDVADLSSVWVLAQVYEADQALLAKGLDVRATTLALAGKVFPGKLDFVHPHLDEATRTLAVRFHIPNEGHQLRPGMYATVTIDVPPERIAALASPGMDQAALQAADGLARSLGSPVDPGPGLGIGPLLDHASRQTLLARGLVLAVPDSAVIDTGRLKIVYRRAAPDTFEGVAVELGARLTVAGSTTAFYPVLRGLEAGDQVVTNGSFLIDAETRLNPAAGSIYFGGSASGKTGPAAGTVRPSTPEGDDALERKARGELAKLNAADRRLAEEQRYCPIRQTQLLGSMGTPVRLVLDGQPVFLCCGSCEEKAKADPKKTLATVEELKKGKRPSPPMPRPAESDAEAQIRANLAKLPAADRRPAEEQRSCPVTGARLGDPVMGVPVKVMVKGQPVFFCCEGCRSEADDHPDRVLAKVRELKAKANPDPHKHEPK